MLFVAYRNPEPILVKVSSFLIMTESCTDDRSVENIS